MIGTMMIDADAARRDKNLLSKKQAGRILGYSELTVKELIHQGVLQAVPVKKPGGYQNFISRDTIDRIRASWGDDGGVLVTPEQAADTLNVSVKTITRYRRAGLLTPVQRGPKCYVRYRLREVVKLRKK